MDENQAFDDDSATDSIVEETSKAQESEPEPEVIPAPAPPKPKKKAKPRKPTLYGGDELPPGVLPPIGETEHAVAPTLGEAISKVRFPKKNKGITPEQAKASLDARGLKSMKSTVGKKKIYAEPPKTPEEAESISIALRVSAFAGNLNSSSRCRIVDILYKTTEAGVSDVVAITGDSQPNASHHLMLLSMTGFAEKRREGVRVFYRLTKDGRQLYALLLKIVAT